MKIAPVLAALLPSAGGAGCTCLLAFALAGLRLAGAEETKPKKETIMPVGVIQIALMTLNAHVAGYGTVEPASAVAGLPPASAYARSSDAEPFDPAGLIVVGTVPVDDAAGLKLGHTVDISTSVANSKVTGTLLSISPKVDPKTGAVTVCASLPADAGFRPGQFVKLSIATEEHRDILAVLVECLVKDPDVGYVVSFVEGNIATQKPVRIGLRDGDFVEIEGEGIKVGQTVVSSGAYALPKVTKVRIITPID